MHAKNVIASDSMLNSAWNIGIVWSAANGNHNIFGGQNAFGFVFQNSDNGVLVFELAKSVDVLDFSVEIKNKCI